MRHLPPEIEEAVRDWIDQNAPTPNGAPLVDAEVRFVTVHEHLIGSMRGSDGPVSGARSYAMKVEFLVAPETKPEKIDVLLACLREVAAEEPQIAGLPPGGRLFLDDDVVESAADHRDPDHDGPIITLAAVVRT